MKKLTAVFSAIIGAAIFALAGCSGGDVFTEKSYSSGEERIETVIVQVEDRELEITTSADERVHINYFDGEKQYLDVTLSDKQLTIKLLYAKEWTDFIGFKPAKQYRKIKIAVPDGLLSLSAGTTNENITVGALSVRKLISLDANGGNISIERLNTGKAISLKAKNGNIAGSVIGGWDDFSISCKIKKGKCNLPALKEGGEKSFTADCNNGDIDIEFV